MARSEFGERLKNVFDNATNKEIAVKIGVSAPAVQNYVNGRVPPVEMLIKIAEVTNCDLHWLLTGEAKAVEPQEPASPPPSIFSEERLFQKVREIVREEMASPIQNIGAIDEFDIHAAIERLDDPHRVMEEWMRSDGLEYPRDYGVMFFDGWESFTPQHKADAIRDARKVLERTLRRKK